jgi:hypothetical protein
MAFSLPGQINRTDPEKATASWTRPVSAIVFGAQIPDAISNSYGLVLGAGLGFFICPARLSNPPRSPACTAA